MKIAIFGGTGKLGQFVVREAISRGHSVVALVRDPDRFTAMFTDLNIPDEVSLTAEKASIFDADSLKPHFADVGAVISCLGSRTLKDFYNCKFYTDSMSAILAAMEANGVKRILKTGGWGLAPHRDSPKYLEWFARPVLVYSVAKNHTAAEKMLQDSADLQYTIIRPPGFGTGAPVEKPIETIEDGQFIAGCAWMMPSANIARFFLDSLEDEATFRKSYAIGIKK